MTDDVPGVVLMSEAQQRAYEQVASRADQMISALMAAELARSSDAGRGSAIGVGVMVALARVARRSLPDSPRRDVALAARLHALVDVALGNVAHADRSEGVIHG